MENISRLDQALVALLSNSKEWADLRHLYTLVWMIIGLIHSGSVNLTKWAMYVQSRANLAQSKQRRFSRWLHNPRINPQRLYSPLIQAALKGWEEEVLDLSLDTSMLWNQYCLIRVAVVYQSDFWIWHPDQGWCQVKDFHLGRSRRRGNCYEPQFFTYSRKTGDKLKLILSFSEITPIK